MANIPIYDVPTALCFVATISGHNMVDVTIVLEAQTIYRAGVGTLPPECVPTTVDLASEIRERYDLFERAYIVNHTMWEAEAEFASQRSELPWRSVIEILLANSAYELAVGIIDGETYMQHQEWKTKTLAYQEPVPSSTAN